MVRVLELTMARDSELTMARVSELTIFDLECLQASMFASMR
jgi:hypothetical protein